MRHLILLLIVLSVTISGYGQHAAMVADYSPGTESTVANSIKSIGGKLYFTKVHGDHEDPYVFDGIGISQIAELSATSIVKSFTFCVPPGVPSVAHNAVSVAE